MDLTGHSFGSWTIVDKAPRPPLSSKSSYARSQFWRVECVCGVTKSLPTTALVRGKSKSCGCTGNLATAAANTRHGLRDSQAYRSWACMKRRCLSPKHSSFKNYGAKGITICERWLNFTAFYEDMGEPPTKRHTIDRIENSRGYEPGNCKWSTMREQRRNTSRNIRVSYHGKQIVLVDLSEITGVPKRWIWTHHKLPDFLERLERKANEKEA